MLFVGSVSGDLYWLLFWAWVTSSVPMTSQCIQALVSGSLYTAICFVYASIFTCGDSLFFVCLRVLWETPAVRLMRSSVSNFSSFAGFSVDGFIFCLN